MALTQGLVESGNGVIRHAGAQAVQLLLRLLAAVPLGSCFHCVDELSGGCGGPLGGVLCGGGGGVW